MRAFGPVVLQRTWWQAPARTRRIRCTHSSDGPLRSRLVPGAQLIHRVRRRGEAERRRRHDETGAAEIEPHHSRSAPIEKKGRAFRRERRAAPLDPDEARGWRSSFRFRKPRAVRARCVQLPPLVHAGRPHRLTWGPAPATHDHCCFGGMLGNNSCGVHAQMPARPSTTPKRSTCFCTSHPARVLLLLGYPDIYQAGDGVPTILPFQPIGLEGIDERLVHYVEKRGGPDAGYLRLLPDGRGWLMVELGADTREDAELAATHVMKQLGKRPNAPSMRLIDRDLPSCVAARPAGAIRGRGRGADPRFASGTAIPYEPRR